jgi:hypothetical protein
MANPGRGTIRSEKIHNSYDSAYIIDEEYKISR